MPDLPPLISAMLDPAFYPHRPQTVGLEQTHTSFIFLAGELVYKVKKPVDFGFLDYTTLEKRRYFCEQEVTLNRRLCPSIYLGVEAVTLQGKAYALGGPGETAEYAVKMRRLPAKGMMDVLLRRHSLTPSMVERVAARLAEFHAAAETNERIAQIGAQSIETNVRENFDQTAPYIDRSIDQETYYIIKAFSDSFLRDRASLLAARVRDGRMRDCHGDLHTAHVCFTDGLCIYDCIEFNERFRYGDVASDVAFLAMDLDQHGYRDLSDHFVQAYVRASSDAQLIEVLDFYKCYRACVRGKVEGFKLDDPLFLDKPQVVRAAGRFFALARSYATGKRQQVVVAVSGLMGTGKTALAEELAGRTAWQVISSDLLRKELASMDPARRHFVPFASDIYSEEFSQRTYEEMRSRAAALLDRGRSVILDASYKRAEERRRVRMLAQEREAGFWLIECVLDDETVRQRLTARVEAGAVSDGRWEIYQAQRSDFDAITEAPPSRHIVLDTSRSVDELAPDVLRVIIPSLQP